MTKKMKKISLKKLNEIKENFDKLVENKIEEIENNCAIASINKMQFNELKSLFECISSKLYSNVDTKHFVKDYMSVIKNSNGLLQMYRLNESITNKSFRNGVDASLFLESSIDLLNKVNKKEINESLNKLRNIVESSAKSLKLTSDDIFEGIKGKNPAINESLNYIITHKKTSANLYDYLENFNNVSTFMNENNVKEKENVEKPNENLNDIIDESMESFEKEAITKISLAALEGKENKTLFEETKKECIGILDESISEEDDAEGKARFETMKLQLESKAYNDETFIDDMLKLEELKDTLN